MTRSTRHWRRSVAVLVVGALAPLTMTLPAHAEPGANGQFARNSAGHAPAVERRARHAHRPRRRRLPSERVWLRDVSRSLAPVPAYLDARARRGGRLAVVLGIDNVALATHYNWPKGVAPTLRVARHARALGMAVFFVTGRPEEDLHRFAGPLRKAGFRWAGMCGRAPGVRIKVAKQRCRQTVTASGYTITANVSSSERSFYGGYYERAVMLPSYGGRLG